MSSRSDRGETRGADPSARNLLVVAKGGGFLAAGDLFNYGSRLVVALVLARVLGADDYGIYTLSVSIAYLAAGIANLGLDSAMERYVAILRARDDEAGVLGTLQLGIGLTLIGTLTVSAIGFFAADPIALGIFDDARLAPMLKIGAFAMLFVVTTTLLAAIVRGFKRMDYSALTDDFIQPLVRLTLIGIFAVIGLTAEVALVIFGVSYLAATAVLIGLVNKLFSLARPWGAGKRYVKEIAAFSFPFWFAGLLTQVRQNIQPMLLGIYSTMANVGIFSLVTSANLLGRVANMAVRTSLRPTLAETLDQGRLEESEHLYQATTRWTLTANLPVFLVMILYPTAILSVFGESFEAGAGALFVLAWAELANAATGTCGAVIDMSGLNLVKLINKIFEVALTLVLNVVFIIQWGLMGAAVATLISGATIQVVRLVEVRIFVGLHPYNLQILKPVLAAVLALGAGLGMDRLVPSTGGPLQLVVDSIVVGAVYVGAVIALGLSEEDRMVLRAVGRRLRPPSRRARATV